MDKTPASGAETPDLSSFRKDIDAIDDQIVRLLLERTAIVQRVGQAKHRHSPGQCPIRPGREAEMVRRIMGLFEGTRFPPAAAGAMWRMLISGSTCVEHPLSFSVFAQDQHDELYWLAREYFGGFVPAVRQPHIKRVIGDVMDGKASIGIVPMLRMDDASYWWTNLLQPGDSPKIFACLPFLAPADAGKRLPSALAIARIAPEPSGNDRSLLVIEADHNVSQSRLQAIFSQENLEVSWINIATLTPASRHHLIEVGGFVTTGGGVMKKSLDGLGSSVKAAHFLGAYAVPVTASLPDDTSSQTETHDHTAEA